MNVTSLVLIVCTLGSGLYGRNGTLRDATDQEVCLQNSALLIFIFDGLSDLSTGSTAAFSLSGVNVGDGLAVSGLAMPPYRFAFQVNVAGKQGGTWSPGVSLESSRLNYRSGAILGELGPRYGQFLAGLLHCKRAR